MIRCSCPHCQATIKASDHAAGKPANCPRCKTQVLLPTQTALEGFDFDREETSSRKRPSFRKSPPRGLGWVWILVAIAAVSVVGVGGLVISKNGSLSHKRELVEKEDPYPSDCRIVREYLDRRYGNATIISWGHRITHDGRFGSSSRLSAKFRADGDTKEGDFIIGPYGTIENATVED